jgi:hypothetical protein
MSVPKPPLDPQACRLCAACRGMGQPPDHAERKTARGPRWESVRVATGRTYGIQPSMSRMAS